MKKSEILEQFRFYRQGPESFQVRMKGAVNRLSLPAGSHVFHGGDDCNQIAFVGKGSIRVFKIGETGREITLYHVKQGEGCFLNIMCVLAGEKYPASAVVESQVESVLLPASTFREWMETSNALRNFVFELMATRFVHFTTLLEDISFSKMDYRLADFLLRRFANDGMPLSIISMTHEQIAAELGTAREVVSRLLKEFERSGAIGLARSRIHLLNDSVLERFKSQ